MRCDDPLIRAFRGYGYNVLRLPSANFAPLLLLESDGRRAVRTIGPVRRELPSTSSGRLPRVRRDDPAPDIAVLTTRRVSGRLAADLLGPVLNLMGLDAGIAGMFGNARGVSIVLRDVQRDWVDVGEVAHYLESGVEVRSQHVRRAADSGGLFIVIAVLKSTCFGTGMDREIAHKIKAGTSMGGPVDVSIEESREHGERVTVSFTGRKPLTFAFQAVRLVYEDGIFTDFVTARGLTGYAMPRTGMPTEGMLLLDDDLIEIEPKD